MRVLFLFGVWAYLTNVFYHHATVGGGPGGVPGPDALSPMSGALTLWELVSSGEFLQHTYLSSVLLFVFTVVLALILRRAFCGWLCPLGAMQELTAGLGRRLDINRRLSGSTLDGSLRWAKYGVLTVTVGMTAFHGHLVFRTLNPWTAYAYLPAGKQVLEGGFLPGLVILGLTLIASAVVERAWCRYLCPLGALLGLVSRTGGLTIARNDHSCVHCRRCDRVCPVDVTIESVEQVTSPECLSCGQCVSLCPIRNTLDFSVYNQRLSAPVVGLLVGVLFFGLLYGAQYTPYWQPLPESWAETVGDTDEPDPGAITGYMSLRDIQHAFGIPVSDLMSTLNLPEYAPTDEQIRHLMENQPGGVQSVREAVRELLKVKPGQEETPDISPVAPLVSPEEEGRDTTNHAPQ